MTLQASPQADCRVCAKPFVRRNTMHAVCSVRCTLDEVRSKQYAEKVERRETRAKLEAMKPRSKWLSEAQAAFNAWVRARDEAAGLPCISCLRHDKQSWDAGHYLTRGARPELRFNERNCWRQCVQCNQHLHGNVAMFRVELVRRIGREAVEKLEGPHPPMHYSVDDLRAIKTEYRAKARELQVSQPA
jgi:hypothetical protein